MNSIELAWSMMPEKVKRNIISIIGVLILFLLLIYLWGYYSGYEASLLNSAEKLGECISWKQDYNKSIFTGWY